MSTPDDAGSPRRRVLGVPLPRRRWVRYLTSGVVAVVLLAVVVAGAGFGYLQWRLHQVKRVHVPSLSKASTATEALHPSAPPAAAASPSAQPVHEPVTFLVVGSDTRQGQSDVKHIGSAKVYTGQRSDVIKLVRVYPQADRVKILSVPRDLFVPIAGTGGSNRINTAFQNGPDQLVRTIQQTLHVPVNHYVLVDFSGFESVVNAVGGVDLYFPTPERDAKSGLDITRTGCLHLDGQQALALARSRHFQYYAGGSWHIDPSSDFGRIERQNVFLQALLRQARKQNLANPITDNALIGSVVHTLTVDDQLSTSDMLRLVETVHGIHASDINGRTLPTRTVNGYGSYGDVLMPDPSADKAAVTWFMTPPVAVSTSAPAASSGSPPGSTASTSAASASPSPSASPSAASASPSPQLPSFDPRLCPSGH